MAPIRFPINDWDGDGSTDSLFDITMEMKVCESFQKEETDFLDELIPELPLNLSTDGYDDDNDYETPDSGNTDEETVIILFVSVFAENVIISFISLIDFFSIIFFTNNTKEIKNTIIKHK